MDRAQRLVVALGGTALVLRLGFALSPRFHIYARRIALIFGAVASVSWRRFWRGPLQPGWPFMLEVILKVMRSGPAPVSIQSLRRTTGKLIGKLPPNTDVKAFDLDGIPAQWIVRCDKDTPNVVLYLHGGGYALMSVDTHKPMITRISRAANARCIGIDYRLAPEHPFPAGLEDALKTYRWLINDQGISPSRIIIAGDSAGGGLTTATLLSLKQLGEPLPAGAILISPWLDLTCSLPSWRRFDKIDYLGKAPEPGQPMTLNLPNLYAGERGLKDPLVSPIYSDPTGLCPLLIQLGGSEVLLDEGLLFAKKARGVGVDVSLQVWPNMPHVFQAFGKLCPGSKEAFENMGVFAKECFTRANQPSNPAAKL